MKRFLCLLLALVFLLGLSASAMADDMLFCRMCGRRIPTDSRVCPYCGVSVVSVFAADQSSPRTQAPESGSDARTQAATVQTQTALVQTQTASAQAQTAQPVPGPFGSVYGSAGSGGVFVTKSPTSESVPYGGSCMFIAHAANATSITWYVCNPTSGSIAEAGEMSDYVSGLVVTGAKSDTLMLSGIPSWMNGFMVQACFEGEGGPVYTEVARIWTYEETWQPDPYWCRPPCDVSLLDWFMTRELIAYGFWDPCEHGPWCGCGICLP